MNILLVGDTHGITRVSNRPGNSDGRYKDRYFPGNENTRVYWWEYLCKTAIERGCDRIFQLGDFGFWEHMAMGRAYVDHVQEMAEKYNLVIYVLDGNHDKISLIPLKYPDTDDEGFVIIRPRIRYAPRGHRWTWEGKKFMAFGGAYSVDKDWRLQKEQDQAVSWDFQSRSYTDASESLWFPEEEATDEDVDAILAVDMSRIDVLLTHDKPRQTQPGWNRKDIPECFPNQDRVSRLMRELKPALVVHGHLHYRYTQQVRTGDDDSWATVYGLQCDVEAGGHIPGYAIADSWLPLHIASEEEDLEE